jgi:DNA-binding NarL/FixJ family response regulator
MVDCLRESAVECIEFQDGETAVSQYSVHHPDWVTMDIDMPGPNGFEAARRIRKLDPQARIVIVSQHDDESLRQAAHQAGACGYLRKEHMNRLRETLGLVPGDPGSMQNRATV